MKTYHALLPDDIWTYLSANHLDHHDIYNLSLTNRTIRNCAFPFLFKNISFSGFPTHMKPDFEWLLEHFSKMQERAQVCREMASIAGAIRKLTVQNWLKPDHRFLEEIIGEVDVEFGSMLLGQYGDTVWEVFDLINGLPSLQTVAFLEEDLTYSEKPPVSAPISTWLPGLSAEGLLEFNYEGSGPRPPLLFPQSLLERKPSTDYFHELLQQIPLKLVSVSLPTDFMTLPIVSKSHSFQRLRIFHTLHHEAADTVSTRLQRILAKANDLTHLYLPAHVELGINGQQMAHLEEYSGPAKLFTQLSTGRNLRVFKPLESRWPDVARYIMDTPLPALHTLDISEGSITKGEFDAVHQYAQNIKVLVLRPFLLEPKEAYRREGAAYRNRNDKEEHNTFVRDLFARLHRFKILETVVVRGGDWTKPKHIMPPTSQLHFLPTPALRLIEFTGFGKLVYEQGDGWFLTLYDIASPLDESDEEDEKFEAALRYGLYNSLATALNLLTRASRSNTMELPSWPDFRPLSPDVPESE